MRFAHTNIVSRDWKLLVDFYVAVFDCEIVPPIRNQSGEWLAKGVGIPGAKLQGAHLRLPGYDEHGPTLEIFQYDTIVEETSIPANKRGFGHIAFEVSDVELVLKRVIQHGGSELGQIVKKEVAGAGIITFVYARDPEGNIIELQHWTT